MGEFSVLPGAKDHKDLEVRINQVLTRLETRVRAIQGLDKGKVDLYGDVNIHGKTISTGEATGLYITKDDAIRNALYVSRGVHTARYPISAPTMRLTQKGVAPEDAVRLDQLVAEVEGVFSPADAAPPSVGDLSVLGVEDAEFAREDHTHAGLDLTTEQTTSGLKHLDGGFSIGPSGPNITDMLFASAGWDPPALAIGASASVDVALAGAVVGDLCFASFGTELPLGFILTAHGRTNIVRVQIFNINGALTDLGNGTLRVWVLKF